MQACFINIQKPLVNDKKIVETNHVTPNLKMSSNSKKELCTCIKKRFTCKNIISKNTHAKTKMVPKKSVQHCWLETTTYAHTARWPLDERPKNKNTITQ